MKLPLSVCIVAHNEQLLLPGNLESLRPWVAETVVVVPEHSSDKTAEIARTLATRFVPWPCDGRLAPSRNRALEEATQPWILVLDGDERLCPSDAEALEAALQGLEDGFTVPIRNYSRTLNLLHDWRPNDGRYPAQERFSTCPGYCSTGVLRLFRNDPSIRYEDTRSGHCSVRPGMEERGLLLGTAPICIHHFEYLKGAENYVLAKTRARLQSELEHLGEQPRDARSLVNAARALFTLGRDEEAADMVERALATPRDPYEALLLGGQIEYARERYAQALAHLERATRARPQAADPWALRGFVLAAQGQASPAQESLRRALELAPWHALAHNSLGVLLEEADRPKEAEAAYRRCLELNPHLSEARYNLGTLLERLDRFPEAVEQYRLGLADRPDDAEMRERLGQLT